MAIGSAWKEIWKPVWKTIWVGAGTPGEYTTPDAFVFIDQTNVELNTTVTSNFITVTGITVPTSISVSGGTYEVNQSGAFISLPSTVSFGDVIRVRHTSSASFLGVTTTTLTIGGVTGSFTSYARASATPQQICRMTLSLFPAKYVNEGSSNIFKIKLYDYSGRIIAPVSLQYRITDITNGRIVKPWTTLPPLGKSEVQIDASDNYAYSSRRHRRFERRVITVQADAGESTQITNEIEYWIRDLVGITNQLN
jgi:hypothetical protein